MGMAAMRFSSSAARRCSGPSLAEVLARRHCGAAGVCCGIRGGVQVLGAYLTVGIWSSLATPANPLVLPPPTALRDRAGPRPRHGARRSRRSHGPIRVSRPGTPRIQLALLGHVLRGENSGGGVAAVVVVRHGELQKLGIGKGWMPRWLIPQQRWVVILSETPGHPTEAELKTAEAFIMDSETTLSTDTCNCFKQRLCPL